MSDPPLRDLGSLRWSKTVNETAFFISTARHLIDMDFVNEAFASEEMPWARSQPRAELARMLDNSLTMCIYEEEDEKDEKETATSSADAAPKANKQVGMARLITDHITFGYLTDVYVLPEYRRYGHARWLMACCREVLESMPAIRRGFLVTGLSYGEAFYKETLGFYNFSEESDHLIALTGRFTKRQ